MRILRVSSYEGLYHFYSTSTALSFTNRTVEHLEYCIKQVSVLTIML